MTQLTSDPQAAGPPPVETTAVLTATRPGRSLPELAGLLVVLVVLIGFFAWRSPYFFNVDNFLNILTAIAVTGIIAMPGTMLLVSAQVDLSVGSAAAFCGVVLAVVAESSGLAAGVLVALLAGLALGVANGFLVTVVKVNALITTLGTLAVLRGFTQLTADGQTVLLGIGFGWLGTARPLGIPLPVILLAVVVAASFVAMRYTVFGRSLYAIGANAAAARLVGIRNRAVIFAAFVLSGLAACLAGLILTSQLSAASPIAASGLELSVITAIVLGGASLSGGRGSVGGTIVGLVIIGVLNNGLILLNVNTFWQDIARGSLLILAVSFDQLRQRLQPNTRG
ncbi:ABC transporter permease [Asanoa siamensis]|uniref:Sugar ABC transporter permease n=1 Tax=Asanoa siamensis TaxID=926357 RepID=A0ABQ4CTV7_9ACTN|nr:ABC transporter permease [Asanoa siamensis]GIF74438.1 sugar ABC transporter permease [Asanoa siamensis]